MLPITIVTPAYNSAIWLRETIESVLAQNYPALEYIVVDDGSTDETASILAEYGEHLRVVRQPNSGEQCAVNAGVALASNDIIGIVNADDPVRPGLLAAAVAAFEENAKLVGVYPDWVMIDSEGHEMRLVTTPEYSFLDMIERHVCIPGPAGFFRRSALQGELPREPSLRYSGDFAFWLKLGLRGPMRRLPGFYASWRQHDGGASSMRSDEIASNKLLLVEQFFRRPDLTADLRRRKRQATSAAYYRAALHAIQNPALPGRRMLVRSYALSPVWRWHNVPVMRRSTFRVLYIFGHPFTARIYRALKRVAPASVSAIATREGARDTEFGST